MKQIRNLFIILIALGSSLALWAKPEVPPGISNPQDLNKFWHVTEGADVYPYAWAVSLRNHAGDGSMYLDNLDEKYGIIPNPYAAEDVADYYKSPYLLPYIGVSASWSDAPHDQADVYKPVGNLDEDVASWAQLKRAFRIIDGTPSIAMIGTNCTFCHSNSMTYRSNISENFKHVFVEGAGNIMNVRGFFRDMAGSTVLMFLNVKKLREFLSGTQNILGFGYQVDQALPIASQFVCQFKNDIEFNVTGNSTQRFFLGNWIARTETPQYEAGEIPCAEEEETSGESRLITIQALRSWFKNRARSHILEYRTTVKEYLEKLLIITVFKDLREEANQNKMPTDEEHEWFKAQNLLTKELQARMEWLANTISGYPDTDQTPSGYGTTDAFGRIGNTVARYDDPVPLKANVSFPHMWGIKYRSMFHWNANTNSVLMRNIGQSFGLGAVLSNKATPEEAQAEAREMAEMSDEDKRNYLIEKGRFRATTNIPNLGYLEKKIYDIKIPQWTELMGDDIDREKVIPGCEVYVKNCMGCHTGAETRVGPSGELINYHSFPLTTIGTDPNQSVMQAKFIDGKPLKEVLFGFTQAVRDQFASDSPGSVDAEGFLNDFSYVKEIRGPEVFRDSFRGETEANARFDLGYLNTPMLTGYVARHLSGVWATAPYLHNGSVANIMELLTPPENRMTQFYAASQPITDVETGEILLPGRAYDGVKLGYFQPNQGLLRKICKYDSEKCFIVDNGSVDWFYKLMDAGSLKDEDGNFVLDKYGNKQPDPVLARQAIEAVYSQLDQLGSGNSNRGHYFDHFDDMTFADKRNLIEFLKVLQPEPEYAWENPGNYYQINKIDPLQALSPANASCSAVSE